MAIKTTAHTEPKNSNSVTQKQQLFLLPANPAFIQLVKYFFVGGTAALCDWGFYWFLINILSIHYVLAAAISFLIATLVNYLLSLKWVFKNSSRFKRGTEVSLIFIVSAAGMLINQLTLVFLVEFLSWHYMLAKFSATGLVFFWNFYLRKYYIFNNI